MAVLYGLAAIIWLALVLAAWRRRACDNGRLLRDLAAIAAFVPVTVAFFWRAIFVDGVWMPQGGGDLASFLYPVYSFAADSIQHGVLPLWNPYLYGGSPFAADIQTSLFYPPNMLAFLTARPFTFTTLEELAILNFFLGAVFTYLYARSLGLGVLSSFTAGTIFGFGGFMAAHLGHLNMISAAIWLPLILLFFHRAVTRGSLLAALWAGAAYGISMLAGHTQIALYIGFTLGLCWLWHLTLDARFKEPVATQQTPSLPRRLASLPITAITAIAAAAVQLLPSYELMRLSLRADLTYAKAAEFSASPTGLITLIIPHFFGDNPAAYWGLKWNLTEVYGYVGILPLLLAIAAILLRRNRRGVVLFLGALAVLSILFSLGEYTVLHGWLYKFVPGFDKVRSAGRFLLLFNLAIALLAATSLDSLKSGITARDRPIFHLFTWLAAALLGGSVFLVSPFYYYALITSQDKSPEMFRRIESIVDSLNLSIIFLAASVGILIFNRYLRRRKNTLQYVALAVIVVDVFSANIGYNPANEDILTGFNHQRIVQYLRDQSGTGRIDSVTNIWDVWQPDITLLNQIGDVQGIFNPMLLSDYNRYWENLGSRSVPGYDLLSVKYVVARKDVVLDWEKFRPALTDAPLLNVYENTKAMPRAWLTPAARVAGRDDILQRLRAPDFDPKSVVLVEEKAGDLPEGGAVNFDGRVVQLTYPSPNEVLISTSSSSPAILFLSDVYYPGWKGFVDGRETEILRANYVFKSVVVPAGAHEVRLVFQPRTWKIGLVVSAATWLALAGLAILSLTRARRRKAS
ncbi:MAG: YfhO family protein [Chloroflexi bacterium]|nr:YfhO family protein [Chloroflexota bacterium]